MIANGFTSAAKQAKAGPVEFIILDTNDASWFEKRCISQITNA